MKRDILLLLSCLCILVWVNLFSSGQPVPAASTGVLGEKWILILDAGHGGEDGGTVEQAATEKEINLAVVLKLKELLENQGIQVVLTRDKDIWC